MLGKLPVPGRPTIWITVGQGPTALAVGASGGCLDIFTLIYLFSPLSPYDPMEDISKSRLLDLRFLRVMIMTMIMMMPDNMTKPPVITMIMSTVSAKEIWNNSEHSLAGAQRLQFKAP